MPASSANCSCDISRSLRARRRFRENTSRALKGLEGVFFIEQEHLQCWCVDPHALVDNLITMRFNMDLIVI